MKSILPLIFITFNSLVFGQGDLFKYSEEHKLQEYVVIKVDSTSHKKLYENTLNWIKEKYNNPSSVIKTSIENEMIRIEGIGKDKVKHGAYGFGKQDVRYTIIFRFKDNKVKFEIFEYYVYIPSGVFVRDEIKDDLIDISSYYNKRNKLISVAKKIPEQSEEAINDLLLNLTAYLRNNTSLKNDDW